MSPDRWSTDRWGLDLVVGMDEWPEARLMHEHDWPLGFALLDASAHVEPLDHDFDNRASADWP
jgi:hypothetical protein